MGYYYIRLPWIGKYSPEPGQRNKVGFSGKINKKRWRGGQSRKKHGDRPVAQEETPAPKLLETLNLLKKGRRE
jgi:hypothetical protein